MMLLPHQEVILLKKVNLDLILCNQPTAMGRTIPKMHALIRRDVV